MGRVHAEVIAGLASVELSAVADERADALTAATPLIGTAPVYGSADEALLDPELEACLVVTPTDTHAAIIDLALDRCLHVFCEKPLTLDLEEGRRLGRRAAAAGRVLQVGFWRRYCPAIVAAKEVLGRGAIERPLFVRSSQWDVEAPPADWCAPERSGGIFVDMGIHDLDELEWLLDDRVVRIEGRPFPPADPSIATTATFLFGTPLTYFPPRQFQLGARLNF